MVNPVSAESGAQDTVDDARTAQENQPGFVVSYPSDDVLLVTVAGAVDLTNVEWMREVLRPQLKAEVRAVVLDLGQVPFLSVAGVELVQQAQLRAQDRGLSLRLVIASHEVHRALEVAGIDRAVPCFGTVHEALPVPDVEA